MEHRSERLKNITFMQRSAAADETRPARGLRLLAILTRERMERMLKYLLDEKEFLSPYGIRSMSQIHETQPFIFYVDGHQHRVNYIPGDSDSSMFGGNSNWRGPVCSCPTTIANVRATEKILASRATHTGKTSCCSTNTSTAKPARVWEPRSGSGSHSPDRLDRAGREADRQTASPQCGNRRKSRCGRISRIVKRPSRTACVLVGKPVISARTAAAESSCCLREYRCHLSPRCANAFARLTEMVMARSRNSSGIRSFSQIGNDARRLRIACLLFRILSSSAAVIRAPAAENSRKYRRHMLPRVPDKTSHQRHHRSHSDR